MSTPILATNNGQGNGAVGVLAMSGPSVRLTEAKMQQWAPELMSAAADIARASAASPLFRRAYTG
jgi:IclR family transcriptional regulator, acetate operon repressor